MVFWELVVFIKKLAFHLSIVFWCIFCKTSKIKTDWWLRKENLSFFFWKLELLWQLSGAVENSYLNKWIYYLCGRIQNLSEEFCMGHNENMFMPLKLLAGSTSCMPVWWSKFHKWINVSVACREYRQLIVIVKCTDLRFLPIHGQLSVAQNYLSTFPTSKHTLPVIITFCSQQIYFSV